MDNENIEIMYKDFQRLQHENMELHGTVKQLKAQLEEKPALTNDESKLLGKIQECKIELKKKNLKKSGYNNHNKYSYFELSDFLPSLELILYENGLATYCYFEDNKGHLVVFDIESGVSHRWSTTCRASQVKENGYDVGVHMKSEQAIQTYARRTLYLQAFDIVEPNSIESDGGDTQKAKKKPIPKAPKKNVSPVRPIKEKAPAKVTAERVHDIITIADKQWHEKQIKKIEADRLPFTWDNAKDFIKELCKTDEEYKACSQSLVFKTGDKA